MIQKKSFVIIAAIVLMAAMSLQAAVQSMPIVEILGTKFYLYEARKNDTLFGIARSNGWDEQELARLNPAVTSPLKKGTKIYYPVNADEGKTLQPEDVHTAEQTELTHLVKRGETVYSISQMYGIPVESIYSLNPDSRNGIKAGESLTLHKEGELKIRKGSKTASRFYTVKPGDTIYGVAKAKGVSVAALMKANPGISENSFRTGMVIKLPARGEGKKTMVKKVEESRLDSFNIHEVKKDETWTSIARKEGVDVKVLKDANPDVTSLKKKQVLTVPKIETVTVEREVTEHDPREQSEDGIQEIYDDLHKVSDEEQGVVKVAILAESASGKKDLDFIRGFLTGVDGQKSKPYKIDVKVVDGGTGSEQVISELDAFKPMMVFMTFDGQIPAYVQEYSEVSHTPVVNTFDVKAEQYNTNPYFIQLLAPSNYFNDGIASSVFDRYGDYTLVMIGDPDDGDQLAASLQKLWDSSKIKKVRSAFEPADFTDGTKYVFYGYDTKKAEVQKLLESVAAVRELSPLGDFVTLGRPNWIVYDGSLEDELHKANAMIPSRFYLDEKSAQAQAFYSQFKSLFDRAPVKSLPLYAGVGYDTANYFISSLASAEGDINAFRPSTGTMQTGFDLKRVSSWGGLVNLPVYLVHFTTFNTIDKITVE